MGEHHIAQLPAVTIYRGMMTVTVLGGVQNSAGRINDILSGSVH